jgi:hypothetical protein
MVTIKTKYIILIWLIILILFTFFCVFRLKYLKEKYNNTPMNNYVNTNENTPIILLINDIAKQDKITSVISPPHCKNLYDDNIAVRSLGYNNCQSAYSNYITKGFDVNNRFGEKKSLAEICPISTKSYLYSQCLNSLINNFTDNANIINGVTNDMTSSINKRLQRRGAVLNNVQNQMNPLIFNKDQNDFKTYMKKNNSVAKYKDDILPLVNNYYEDKYSGGLGYAGDNNIEGFIAGTPVYIMDPAIRKLFFGNYKPINNGQFLAFDDLEISLDYDGPEPTISQNEPTMTMSSDSSPTLDSSSSPIFMPVSNPGLLNQITNIILTISSKSNNLNIAYNIVNIDNYKSLPNTIKIIISTQKILSNSDDAGNSQTIMQLLSTLGLRAPMQLIMSYEEFKSTSGILHKTYKLINDNLDTILVMNKN